MISRSLARARARALQLGSLIDRSRRQLDFLLQSNTTEFARGIDSLISWALVDSSVTLHLRMTIGKNRRSIRRTEETSARGLIFLCAHSRDPPLIAAANNTAGEQCYDMYAHTHVYDRHIYVRVNERARGPERTPTRHVCCSCKI